MVREGGGGDAAPTPCFPWSVGEPQEREAGRLAFGGIVERDLSGAISDGGTPYLRAFDFLVWAHEDGADVLTNIFRADLERGPAYVREVFERSERPPLCPPSGESSPECVDGYRTFHKTPWCRAGGLLY